jgi:hypothetical protein
MFKSSEMLCRFDWFMITDVAKDTTFLRIADKYLPAHKALHVTRLQIFSSNATARTSHLAYWPSDRRNVLHMRRVIGHSFNRKPDKSWVPPVVFQVCNGMTSPIIKLIVCLLFSNCNCKTMFIKWWWWWGGRRSTTNNCEIFEIY